MAKGNEGREFVSKLLELPDSEQTSTASEHIRVLFQAAEQSGQVSNNACQKLCFFIEQCRKSRSQALQDIAMSNKTCLDLFNFYIEWNERHQHKSMRQILELSSTLVTANKDEKLSKDSKSQILQRSLAVIAHQGPQPLVKPAFKALELYFMKKSLSPADLLNIYATRIVQDTPVNDSSDVASTLDSFVLSIFEWMTLQDTAPSAGKFLVSFFAELDSDPNLGKLNGGYSSQWKRWIHEGLEQYPESLENIQRHLFPPLFKTDRNGSVEFLQQLTELKSLPLLESGDFDASAFLFLAAMEAGKKLGLVEELEPLKLSKIPGKVRNHVLLPEDVIGDLLAHPAGIVRTSALSVLVTSSAPGRPFTAKALGIIQANIGYLHADTDAKFRNEVLSSTRHLAERLRAATATLKREHQSVEFKQQANNEPPEEVKELDPLSTKNSANLNNTSNLSQQITAALQSHLEFLSWYLDFLSGELVSTASYQRHITSLRAIQLFIRSGIGFPVQTKSTKGAHTTPQIRLKTSPSALFTPTVVRLLLDCLADPFEDVRVAATEILRSSAPPTCFDEIVNQKPGDMPAVESLGLLKLTTKRLQHAAEVSGRADQADGVSRCHELLYQFSISDEAREKVVSDMIEYLEGLTAKAEENLSVACEAHPIHGQFSSLNAVWRQVLNLNSSKEISPLEDPIWQEYQERILRCCRKIWDLVSPILCDDSPEGLELEDMDDETGTETKGLLSYGWRAVHESSRLTSTMAQGLKLRLTPATETTIKSFLSQDHFAEIGEMTFTQLATLRHRGAFSTVHGTFSIVCALTQSNMNGSKPLEYLLMDWYNRAKETLFLVKSTTRRSAGIPIMYTSIMAAGSQNPSFDEIMTTLLELAAAPIISDKDETNLYQVHALNCLRETFKSSILGRKSEVYISKAIALATSCLKSPKWAIRNCGSLLFRSLIDRLFGTSENKAITEDGWNGQSVRLDYAKYPVLSEVLLEMLVIKDDSHARPSTEIGAIQSVFPAMDIIRRAGPPEGYKQAFEKAVHSYLSSPAWAIRELAARTLATMIPRDSWSSPLIKGYLQQSPSSNNTKMGYLMVVQHVLERQLKIQRRDVSAQREELRDLVKLANRFGELEGLGWWAQSPSYVLALRELCHCLIIDGLAQNRADGSSSDIYTSADIELLSRDNLLKTLTVKDVMRKKAAYQKAVAVITYHKDSQRLAEHELCQEAIQYIGYVVGSTSPKDVEPALLFLERISGAWDLHQLHQDNASKMIEVFKTAYMKFNDPKTRACCLETISMLVDGLLYKYDDHRNLISHRDLPISKFIQTPEYLNAVIRFSGSLLLQEVIRYRCNSSNDILSAYLKHKVSAFGRAIMENGTSKEDFDTRFAAVTALQSFLGHRRMPDIIKANLGNVEECFNLVLLALLDALVDDDDEIREVAAKAAAVVAGQVMIPLKAASWIVKYLVNIENCNKSISRDILLRLTGTGTGAPKNVHITSVERQLTSALREDTALFVEEEQNLFIDEVREMEYIVSAIMQEIRPGGRGFYNCWNEALGIGYDWTMEGLRVMSTQMQIDGPFGWASRPAAYAICVRLVLMCRILSKAFIYWKRYAIQNSPELESEASKSYTTLAAEFRGAMLQFQVVATAKNLHPRLLEKMDYVLDFS